MQIGATYGYLTVQVLRGKIGLGAFTGYAAAIRNLSETLVTVVQAYLNLLLYGEKGKQSFLPGRFLREKKK